MLVEYFLSRRFGHGFNSHHLHKKAKKIIPKNKSIRRRFFHRRPVYTGPRVRINEYIRISPVRLIDDAGQQVGVVATSEALQMAKEKELDLVEIVPNSRPPVVKIMDFGKYQYQKAKESQQQKANQKKTEIKGLRIGLKTDDHDIEVRRKQAEKFLSQGNKVRIEIRLKGREKAHQPLARAALDNFIKAITVSNKFEQEIKRFPGGFNAIIIPA